MFFKSIACAAACCVFLSGCRSGSEFPEGVVTVNFHDYIEKPLSELPGAFHSGKRYVALSAESRELMIGEIGRVVLHGNLVYVSENAWGLTGNHRVVVHDADGRALAKIGSQGRGPGEYLQISDFDVDAAGRVHLLDNTIGVKKIFIFAPDGKFVGEKQLPFSSSSMKCTPDGGYIFSLNPWDSSEQAGKRVVKTDSDIVVTASAGEFRMNQIDEEFSLGDGILTATPDGMTCALPPDENILVIDDDGNVLKTIFCDLGRYAIPPDERNNLESVVTTDRLKSYRILSDFTVPWGEYIFGHMVDRGRGCSYVYDTAAGVMYSGSVETGDFGAFVGITNNRLVAVFPALSESNLPSDLPEALRSGVLSGDPLLCLYVLK